MKKIFLFAIMAVVLVSCNQNAPEEDAALLGKWSSNDTTIIEVTFNNDHTLLFVQRLQGLDHTPGAILNYSTKDNILNISGDQGYYMEPFSFSTGYRIEETKLTLDSFSYNGNPYQFYKPLVLYRE